MKNVKLKYQIFDTFRSTGFIVPVLYLFIQKNIGLTLDQIIKISGVYILLPFFLEVPLGYLSDKIGNKKIIQLGMIVQILSCLFLLSGLGNIGYHAYLVAIYFAAAAYSGADQALISPYFKDTKEFKTYLLKISGNLYKYSIIFLLVGAAAFQVDARLPLVIQILSLSISFYAISQINEIKRSAHLEVNPLKDFGTIGKFLLNNSNYLGLALLTSVFGAAINLNHKTIQSTFMSNLEMLFTMSPALFLGMAYAVGNLASYKGSRIFSDRILKDTVLTRQLVIISIMGVLAFSLLTINHIAFTFAGFLLLNVFKALYRPIISAELTTRFPIQNLRASALSVISLIGAIISSIIHFVSAPMFQDPFLGNIFVAAIILAIGIIGVFLSSRKTETILILPSGHLTDKSNSIVNINGKNTFIQKYPEETNDDHFHGLKEIAKNAPYPHSMLEICHMKKHVVADYLFDHELKINNNQKSIVEELLQKRRKTPLVAVMAGTPELESVFKGHISDEAYNKLFDDVHWGNIHADLHPGNILVVNEKAIVIDWDLAGAGHIWFDYLTLLTHPWLSLSPYQRSEIFRKDFSEFSPEEVHNIFTIFRAFKAKQLESFSKKDAKLAPLVNAYLLPLV